MTQVGMTNKLVSRGYCLNPYPFWRESQHWLGMGMDMRMYILSRPRPHTRQNTT